MEAELDALLLALKMKANEARAKEHKKLLEVGKSSVTDPLLESTERSAPLWTFGFQLHEARVTLLNYRTVR